jgi:hypothetical protein
MNPLRALRGFCVEMVPSHFERNLFPKFLPSEPPEYARFIAADDFVVAHGQVLCPEAAFR